MNDNEKNLNAEDVLNDSPKYPQRAAERMDEQASFEGVYAGPEQMPQPQRPVTAVPTAPSAMMTYAGPDFYNNPNGFLANPSAQLLTGMMMNNTMPVPDKPLNADEVFCEMCGSANLKTSKFCKECGSPLKKSDGESQL